MKAKGILQVFFFFILSVALFSCRKDEDVEPIEEYMPLQVGNHWIYHVSDYDSEGNVVGNSSFTRAVVKDTVINGGKWYILNDGNIVQNNRDGYVYFNRFNRAGDQAVILYQNAATGGIGYMYEYPNYKLWLLTTRTYETTPLVTQLGNFPSYVFTIERQYIQPNSPTTNSTWQKDYISPGLGMVRSDRFYAGSADVLFRRYELISYLVQ
ncbi:hypothetical protein ACFSRY_17020 [Pontibacter locisalis]|uniref:Uncharacterized protein n=1 Tax=Pontibacter locisalis TaxID=1719035 RepID=A0ABW5IQ60_9BACT